MSQPELLTNVSRVLTELGIEFVVTGSVVSSMQGEPRATHDTDLVVALPTVLAGGLEQALRGLGVYVSRTAIDEAIRNRTMFNIVSDADGEKVDFWMLTDEPFDRERFRRRRTEHVLGVRVPVTSPEDTILAKLRWAKLYGGSEKQFGDALRVYEVQHATLDLAYLAGWAKQLGVEDDLARLQAEAEPL